MIRPATRLMAIIAFILLSFIGTAQQPANEKEIKEKKPYRILTSGKQVTVKSTKEIKYVMLWTIGGNRVVEQKEINTSSCTFTIPVNQKNFYLMIGLDGGKIYTEKIGIQ